MRPALAENVSIGWKLGALPVTSQRQYLGTVLRDMMRPAKANARCRERPLS